MTTATGNICEALEVHGATIGNNEIDNRPLPDTGTIETAISCLFEPITGMFEDSPLVQDLESALWGIVNTFHAQANRLERMIDDNERTQARLRDQDDGSEINDAALIEAIDQGRALIDRKNAFLNMFDAASREFEALTGTTWRTRYGSRQKTKHITAALIDSRDVERARRQQWNEDHLPPAPYVVVSGGKDFQDVDAIWSCLDRVKAKHDSFTLLHGGYHGVDTIAAAWADNRGIHQIPFSLRKKNKNDNQAGFRRIDKMLGEMPIGAITFPGTGLTKALIREARKMGIPVWDYEETQAKCGTRANQPNTGHEHSQHQETDAEEPTNNEPVETLANETNEPAITPATAKHLTDQQLIDALGVSMIAEHFGLTQSTVKRWQNRGMPETRRDALEAFATN